MNYLYFTLFVVTIIILLIVVIAVYLTFKEPTNNIKEMPRKIWTFWDSEEIPKMIKYCITTWRVHNKNYEVTLLSSKNIKNYLPDFDLSTFRHADSPARISDCIRLNILAVHGGIWIDASMICNKSLHWVEDAIKDKEFVGYYIDSFTSDPNYPVIESWFFACIPNSGFVKKWRDTFMKMNSFENVEEYVHYLVISGVDTQKIGKNMQNYLAIHVAAQYVLQVLKYPQNGMVYFKAEDGPYKYLVKNDWDSDKAVKDLIDGNDKSLHTDLVKLRGDERSAFEKYAGSLIE